MGVRKRWSVLTVSTVLLSAWLAGVSAFCADLPVGTREFVDDGVRLRLYMPKLVYTLGEPIVVEVGITNLAETPRFLGEASCGLTVSYDIRQVKGSEPMPSRMEVCCGLGPDYGWEFKAGEERRSGDDLQDEFAFKNLPTGIYAVSATYEIRSRATPLCDWHGRISTPEVQFSVVAPDASLVAASEVFVQLRTTWPKTREEIDVAAARLHSLRDKEKGGPFSLYAGYKEAMLYTTVDPDRAIDLHREYLREHPSVPHYSQSAIHVIASIFYRKKEFDSARLQIQALPDGYDKKSSLRSIDYAEAR